MIKEKYNAASRYLAPKVKMASLCTRGGIMVGSPTKQFISTEVSYDPYEPGFGSNEGYINF